MKRQPTKSGEPPRHEFGHAPIAKHDLSNRPQTERLKLLNAVRFQLVAPADRGAQQQLSGRQCHFVAATRERRLIIGPGQSWPETSLAAR